MSLTGLPLILSAWSLLVAAAVATVRLWRRMPARITGLVLVEVLTVLAIALTANRAESFYPSWRSLVGDATAATVTEPTESGRLDRSLDAGTVVWSPPEAAGWHLAVPPALIAGSDYARLPDRRFPVVVVLTTEDALTAVKHTAARATGVLTVVLVPTGKTDAATLSGLSAVLSRDARATDGIAVVAAPAWRKLATAWPAHAAFADFDEAVRMSPPPLAAPMRLPS
ncbi:hypothetical protein Q0Z83_053810 [Actinoplanes sichuanensis]|uniref:Uncharacterized protein n=1 Tax=Actinoplanes sichuanensis TaxID=512349 RepID=A0ABW4ASB9_9ACTN|nr:hypothetical protein [Actinoplanes sichuanensis]BEL07190.1 hypothetical protein Q0Z83_053810 [Actinoplanes sichuanensis]